VSLFQAVVSSTLSVVGGLILTLLLTRARTYEKFASLLWSIPFSIPTLVAVYFWLQIIFFLNEFGFSARPSLFWIITAHVAFNIPFAALLLTQARMKISETELEAARTLGAGRWVLWKSFIFSQMRPAFFIALLQIYMMCMMSFALVLLLGGGPPNETLELGIYKALRAGQLDMDRAVAFALLQMILIAIPGAFIMPHLLKKSFSWSQAKRILPIEGEKRHGKIFGMLLIFISALLSLPYLFTSLSGIRYFFSESEFLFRELLRPTLISIGLSTATMVVSLTLATLSVFALQQRSKINQWVMTWGALPGAISPLTLGLGLWLLTSDFFDPFLGQPVFIVLLMSLQFLPLALRWLWEADQRDTKNLYGTARVLGANPFQAFWVSKWISWRSSLLWTGALIFSASFGELAAVSLFYSESLVPLSLQMSRWMGRYAFWKADAAAAMMILFSLAGLIAASRLAKSQPWGWRRG